MGIRRSTLWGQPQTYLLLGGTALGYALMIVLAGPKPVAVLAGSGVAAAMVSSWAAGFRPSEATANSGDLLDAQTFASQLGTLEKRVPPKAQKTWREVQDWSTESQRFAARIYDRDPLLQVELLEALHTVLDLSGQVADGLAVLDQIETPAYQQMAQQRLAASRDRLQATHSQLQQLQDQVALSTLDTVGDSTLPHSLQSLIEANKTILQDNQDSA
ncbi:MULTISPECIES: hypothetical protein [Cyanophyceae]|uniref:hypothetical protein n=1 Tax=Cyanophyceae TaxID=3028117 RepID=UPI001689F366|nr:MULTISPECIES: hypothetical protein [Cyanophyceae]MBD1917664.1 hypothetical protein [Phormidium sp. FACHB-77]MBD2031132.1 hypothetical protein [Phormidium sp. FACHB-322]MBD2053561.1 hypothetical protein [Leptolyngbya sp. FACHB-60]